MANHFEKGQQVRDTFSKAVGTVTKAEKENVMLRFKAQNPDDPKDPIPAFEGAFKGKRDKITVDFGGKHRKPEIYYGGAGLEALKP